MFNSIHPFPSDESYFLSLAQTKKEICVKVIAVSASIFLFLSVTIPVVHLFLPRSAFFYGYTGVGLLGGLLVITALSLKSYLQWKKCKAQVPSYEPMTVLGCKGFRKEEIKKPPSEGSEKKAIVPTEVVKPETQLIEGNFIALPVDVLFSIMKKLKLKDLCRMAQTCKAIDLLLKQDDFWRGLISSDFGVEFVPRNHFKKEYRFLDSLRNNFGNVYSKISSEKRDTFLFNNKLHLKNDQSLSDGNDTLIENSHEKRSVWYFNLKDALIVTKSNVDRNFTTAKVYDPTYKYLGVLDVTVKKSNPETLQGPQIISLSHGNTLYLFDNKTLEPLHHIKFDSDITNLFCKPTMCYVFLKNGDIFLYETDYRSPKKYESELCKNTSFIKVLTVGDAIFFVYQSKDWTQLFLFSSKDLSEPYLTFQSDLYTKVSHYDNFFCFTHKGNAYVWDILKKSVFRTIPFVKKEQSTWNAVCKIHKKFLFLSTDYSEGLQIIDLINEKVIYKLDKSAWRIDDLEFLNDQLIISSYFIGRSKFEVIDFGKFIS